MLFKKQKQNENKLNRSNHAGRIIRYRDIVSLYRQHCEENTIEFQNIENLRPYDDSTLFCIAGMQQYKNQFTNLSITGRTLSNIQPCLRLNDLEEIGDGSHLLYFKMIGLFSFRHWTVKQTIDFWMKFLQDKLSIKPDYVTVHPDKIEWVDFYKEYDILVTTDQECIWTDGTMGGYCTEFYYKDVEIGNIVNCNGDCIDVGFGLERLDNLVNNLEPKTSNEILQETILMIIKSGYKPSGKLQGYVLKKLLRMLYNNNGNLNHEFFVQEVKRQQNLVSKYNNLKEKYKYKSKEWWFDTHGINLDDINSKY